VETKAECIERAASACAALVDAWEKAAEGAQPRGRIEADELAMPRRRGDERRKGGKTVTRYFVPDPKIVRRTPPKRPAVERGGDASESTVGIVTAPRS
jgi:hypothetical protein